MDTGIPNILIDAIDALSLPPDTRVLVATSGGSDSVALALAFQALSLQPGKPLRLRLAHINHGLRGMEADEDEVFVRAFASRLGLEVEAVRVDTSSYAVEHRQSIETAARELRYGELRRMLHAWGGDLIAVGHHVDDQAETVLMNLMRGAGLEGLAGMSVRSGDIIRPFLRLSHETIITALGALGESHRVDRSNADQGPRRNQIRHQVLPILEEIRPHVSRTIARTASLLGGDVDYLHAESVLALRYMDTQIEPNHVSAATGVWRALHPALQARALRLLVQAVTGDVRDLSEKHVAIMREAITGSGQSGHVGSRLPHLLRLEVVDQRVHLFQGEPTSSSIPDSAHLPIPGDCETAFGHFQATISSHNRQSAHMHELAVCGPHHGWCDADVLGDRLRVRRRQPGDRLSLLHSPGSRKLQDLFVDAKIPRRERDKIPVLETDEFIVWVPGFEVDRRASIGPETTRVAHLRFRTFL